MLQIYFPCKTNDETIKQWSDKMLVYIIVWSLSRLYIDSFFMKFAFVHCRIAQWWALSVLKDLIDEQKWIEHATVFTLFSDTKQLTTKHHTVKVVTALPTWINQLFLRCSTHKIPLLSRLFDYRNLMFFYPSLMNQMQTLQSNSPQVKKTRSKIY